MKRKDVNVLIISSVCIILLLSTFINNNKLNVDIKVVEVRDDDKLYRITNITIIVKNNEDFAIEPLFFVVSQDPITYKVWEFIGKKTLKPGEMCVYHLYPISAYSSIKPGETFYIVVVDKKTMLKAYSEKYKFNIIFPGVQNPRFKWWVYDSVTNTYKPFAWWYVRNKYGEEIAGLEKVNDSVVKLYVSNLNPTRTGNWLMSGLQQTISFPEFIIVRVKPTFSTPINLYPKKLSGIEIADRDKRIWILFTNYTDHSIILRRISGNYYYVLYFVPVKIDEWNLVKVNIKALYDMLNWSYPKFDVVYREGKTIYIRKIDVTLLVALYPGADVRNGTVYFGEFSIKNYEYFTN